MSDCTNKRLLFISWDGPQTYYMEGLFMPIFQSVAKRKNIKFHVIQFTWGDNERVAITKQKAIDLDIVYTSIKITRKPIAILGSLFTIIKSFSILREYIKINKIDVVMPRSTFPAILINRIKRKNFKILFDADGLPLEERVDFAGLSKGGLQYKLLKKDEILMIKNADGVLTRTFKSIDIYLKSVPRLDSSKFSVVINGKDPDVFKIDQSFRENIRRELNIGADKILFIYSGSLGAQYGLNVMLKVFENFSQYHKCHFLVLTGDKIFAENSIPEKLKTHITVRTVVADKIPEYLNAADVAFAIRQPSFSMQGVAPIKLGEYLLCGLPVIASRGIGDTEEILADFHECFLYDNNKSFQDQMFALNDFILRGTYFNKFKIREKAIPYFSLRASVDSYIIALEKLFL